MLLVKEAKKQKEAVTKGAKKLTDGVQSMADNAWTELNKRVEGAGNSAKVRSAGLAIALIKVQRSAFDRTLKLLAQVQKQSDKLLKDHVEEAAWMPAEGRDIIKEWNRTLNDGRAEFQKTVDKSYDLLRMLFERVEKKAKQRTAKTSGSAKAAIAPKKKAPARKKSVVKKAAAKADKVASVM